MFADREVLTGFTVSNSDLIFCNAAVTVFRTSVSVFSQLIASIAEKKRAIFHPVSVNVDHTTFIFEPDLDREVKVNTCHTATDTYVTRHSV